MNKIYEKRKEIKTQLSFFKQNIDRLIEREYYFYFINFLSFYFIFYTSIELSKRIKNIIDNSTIDKNIKFKFDINDKKFKKIKNKNKNKNNKNNIFKIDVNIISIDRLYR